MCLSMSTFSYYKTYHISLAGDARNEVMTTRELSKLKFDPSIYRTNALQGLVYDPARELPHIHCAHCSISCHDF